MTSGTAYLLGMKKSSGGGTQSESSFLVQAINHCLTHPLTRLSGTLRIKTMMGCLIRGPQIPISISSKMVGIPCRCIATSETVQPMGVIITFISTECLPPRTPNSSTQEPAHNQTTP